MEEKVRSRRRLQWSLSALLAAMCAAASILWANIVPWLESIEISPAFAKELGTDQSQYPIKRKYGWPLVYKAESREYIDWLQYEESKRNYGEPTVSFVEVQHEDGSFLPTSELFHADIWSDEAPLNWGVAILDAVIGVIIVGAALMVSSKYFGVPAKDPNK